MSVAHQAFHSEFITQAFVHCSANYSEPFIRSESTLTKRQLVCGFPKYNVLRWNYLCSPEIVYKCLPGRVSAKPQSLILPLFTDYFPYLV